MSKSYKKSRKKGSKRELTTTTGRKRRRQRNIGKLLVTGCSSETQEIEKISSIKVSTGLKQASITDSGSHNSTGSELFDKCILAHP